MKSKFFSKDPNELRTLFLAMQSARDIARFLEINYNRLVYHVYIIKDKKKYTTFSIPKKSGEIREISAPISAIKIMQRKLNHILQICYKPKGAAHGFIRGKNIVTNARFHIKQRIVLCFDLKDFSPQ